MASGFIYALKSDAMPHMLKIGMTTRSPLDRLEEANRSDTFRPPLPYYITLAKKVSDPRGKERALHAVLDNKRVNPDREFFYITVDEVARYFDMMDGKDWVQTSTTSTSSCDEDDAEEDYEVEEIRSKKMIHGKMHYEVKWAGYPESANEFIPIENFSSYMKRLIQRTEDTIPYSKKTGHKTKSFKKDNKAGMRLRSGARLAA